MAVLLLLIAALAGIIVLVKERQQHRENLHKMQSYVENVVSDASLLDREKMTRIIDLCRLNGYKVEDLKAQRLTAEHRDFSLGAALLWFSLGGVGMVIYLVYYFIKNPEQLHIDLQSGSIHA